MAKVVTTFVSDDKEMAASIDKYNRKIDQLIAENRKLAEESRQASQKGSQGFVEMGTSLLGVIGSIQTARSILQSFNGELERRNQLEKEYLATQTRTASPEREFLMNLGFGADSRGARQQISEISKRTGVKVSELYSVAGQALSATGGDVGAAMDATERAAQIAPHSTATMQNLTTAMVNLGKAYGELDNEKGLALLISTAETSGAGDWAKIANNAPRSIIGASALGFRPEEAAALFSTFTQISGDTTGATSGTGVQMLAGKLREFLPEEDVYKNGKLVKRSSGLATGMERFEALESDEKLRKQFFNTLEQSEMKASVELILTPDTMANATFKNFIRKTDELVGKGDIGAEFARGLNSTATQYVENARRKNEAAKERFDLEQAPEAAAALARDDFFEMQNRKYAKSVIGMTLPMERAEFYANMLTEGSEEQLSRVIDHARVERDELMGTGGFAAREKISERDREVAEALGTMVETLQDLRNDLRAPRPGTHGETK